jgi:hypothetical protein
VDIEKGALRECRVGQRKLSPLTVLFLTRAGLELVQRWGSVEDVSTLSAITFAMLPVKRSTCAMLLNVGNMDG